MWVNLDKKEFVHPHDLNGGAKLWEICVNRYGGVINFLLRKSSEGGGGDIHQDYEYAGRWAGDRIVLVGDYDESKLQIKAEKEFLNISKAVKREYYEFIGTVL